MAPTASSSSSAQPLTLATILAPDLSPTATASLRTALANLSHTSSFEADLWLASPSPPSTPDALDTLVDWHPSAVGVTWVVSARVSVALEQCYVEGGRTAADEARAWDAWRAARRYMDDGVGAFVGEPEAARVNLLATAFLHLSLSLGAGPQAVLPLRALLAAWARWPAVVGLGPPAADDPREQLTAVHGVFLEACVRARAFNLAQGVLDRPIEAISTSRYALTPQAFHSYAYHAALCALALDRLAEAEDLLLACVEAPAAGAAGAMQVGAWKKLVLVQLLKDGVTSPLPKYTSSAVAKAVKTHGAAYRRFADVFAARVRADAPASGSGGGAVVSLGELDGEAIVEADALRKDHNLGLAKRVLRSLVGRRVARAAAVYDRLSLADLGAFVGVGSGEERALESELGRLAATATLPVVLSPSPTDPSSTLVSFPSPTALSASSPAAQRALVARLEALDKRAERVQRWCWEEDRRLGLDGKWIAKLAKDAAAAALPSGPSGPAAGPAGMAGLTMDEDLMEGLDGALGGFSTGGGGGGGGGGVGGKRNAYEDDY